MSNVTTPATANEPEQQIGLDDLAREGARRMIAAALEAEVADYIERHTTELDDDGHRRPRLQGRSSPQARAVTSTLPETVPIGAVSPARGHARLS